MREWTLEERYRVLQSADEIKGLHEALLGSVYQEGGSTGQALRVHLIRAVHHAHPAQLAQRCGIHVP